jgi:shikimate kinase
MKHLVLVGLSGAGKSTIGRLLHKTLDMPLIDTDRAIEVIQDRSVSDIFEMEGDVYFRELETLVLRHLKLDAPSIIATGGGMVLREENRGLLKKLGIVVWLNTSPEDIVRVIEKDTTRPLLEGSDKLKTLQDLFEQRKDVYAEVAHFEVSNAGMTESEVADKVAAIWTSGT